MAQRRAGLTDASSLGGLANQLLQTAEATHDARLIGDAYALVGDAAQARGDLTAAEQAYTQYLAISEQLAARDPANTGWQRDLTVARSRVGDMTQARGDVDALREGGAFPITTMASPILAPPSAGRPGTTAVRPGHGLDGPEITSSWPAQPQVGDPESFEDFWQDDEDEEYTGLFGDREAEFERADSRSASAKRRIGRHRGGSNDHRLWLGLGGVVIVAAAAITGIIKFEFPSHSEPAHTMVTPTKIGAYARTVDLEHQADVAALKEKVIKMSSGQASRVVSAVYESGNSAADNTAQIIMFIGGHLADADPAASIASFMQTFPGAKVVKRRLPGRRSRVRRRADRRIGQRVRLRLVRQRQLRRDRLAHDERHRLGQRDADSPPVRGAHGQAVAVSPAVAAASGGRPGHAAVQPEHKPVGPQAGLALSLTGGGASRVTVDTHLLLVVAVGRAADGRASAVAARQGPAPTCERGFYIPLM